jgi:hypothetical protein
MTLIPVDDDSNVPELEGDDETRKSRFCGGRFYGGRGTIHGSTELNVEVDRNGHVVSVWFRCQPLPFSATIIDDSRAREMHAMYTTVMTKLKILGVELLDGK